MGCWAYRIDCPVVLIRLVSWWLRRVDIVSAGFSLEQGSLSGRQRQHANIQVIDCIFMRDAIKLAASGKSPLRKRRTWRKYCGGGAHRLLVGFGDDMPLRPLIPISGKLQISHLRPLSHLQRDGTLPVDAARGKKKRLVERDHLLLLLLLLCDTSPSQSSPCLTFPIPPSTSTGRAMSARSRSTSAPRPRRIPSAPVLSKQSRRQPPRGSLPTARSTRPPTRSHGICTRRA